MNIEQLKRTLPKILKSGFTPLLVGNQGIGKSSVIKQYAQEHGLGFIDMRLGLMADPGDLTGMPYVKDGRMHYAVPSILPTSGRGILFIDELNRATRMLLQAVFQLVLDGRIGEYVLPEGWSIITAMNPATDNFIVTDIADDALKSRFLHIKLEARVEDFAAYMDKDSIMAAFVKEHPSMLIGSDFSVYNELKPCGRVLEVAEKIIALEPDQDVFAELLMGLLGTEGATVFLGWYEKQDKALTAEDVFTGKFKKQVQGYIDNNRLDLISVAVDNVRVALEKPEVVLTQAQIKNIRKFLLMLPNDSFIAAINSYPTHDGVDSLGHDRRLTEKCIQAQQAGQK